MKKKVIIIIATFLVLVLFVSILSSCLYYSGQEESSKNTVFTDDVRLEVEADLISRGYPTTVITRMNDQTKKELFENKEFTFAYSNADDPDAHSDNELELYWIASKSMNEDGALNEIMVDFAYKWNDMPSMRLQDQLQVMWSRSELRVKEDSFYSSDDYDANVLFSSYDDINKSLFEGFVLNGNDEVNWYGDLKGNAFCQVTNLYGNCHFILIPETEMKEGDKVQFYFNYKHVGFGNRMLTNSIGTNFTFTV